MDKTEALYKTAKLIYRSIANSIDEKKKSDMVSILSNAKDVPTELRCFMHWILVGPEEELQKDIKCRTTKPRDRCTNLSKQQWHSEHSMPGKIHRFAIWH